MGMFRLVDVVDALKTGRVGEGPRIRVEDGSAGFNAGRVFRMFDRINLASGGSHVIKAVLPVDVILSGLSLELVDGWAEVETVAGGIEGGTFGTAVPTFNANTMDERPLPLYEKQTTLTSGGTHTGGTVLDVLMARSPSATAQATSVGISALDSRGVVAGTYYFRITNPGNGTALGVIKARWEERPPGTYGPIAY